jgi:hypothetical protein
MPVLRHPDLEQTIDVAEARVPVLAKSGWVPVDAPTDLEHGDAGLDSDAADGDVDTDPAPAGNTPQE